MVKVILSEKPSVAKNIADALKIKTKQDGYFEGNGYIVTWAFGHLLQLFDALDYDAKLKRWHMDNFPFIPNDFRYKVKRDFKQKQKEDFRAKKQLKTIHQLINRSDVDGVIQACDYDREGQIIGDTIIYQLKTKKQTYRLLLNEWTADEVNRGLERLKPNTEMRPLLDAGISRQWADWVIGINLTSVATLKYQKGGGKALNIGRVLLPTLKIIYDRDKEINEFVPKDYAKLAATFQTPKKETYEGTYTLDKQDKFEKKEELEAIQKLIDGKQGTVIKKTVEKKKEFPPYLFNLSNLQGYITSKYKGFTSDKVLKVAQSLYEKKYITYPRTASVVLDETLTGKAKQVLDKVKTGLPYEDEIQFAKKKRVFDSSKVDSHSAIMPTYVLPKSLNRDEELVYTAIKNRFIMQFMPIAEYEETKLTTQIEKEAVNGVFLTSGRVQLVEGFKKVEKIESKDQLLPFVNEGEAVDVMSHKVSMHTTKPPKPHTEKTLLRVMETCGKKQKEAAEDNPEEMMQAILSGYSIGTPATRAETIKKLKDVGYITANQKNLVCTELGVRLVETFPVKELFDLEFTGRLEKTLSDIEKQKQTRESFLQFIYSFTRESVDKIKQDQDVTLHVVERARRSNETLGKCPLCQSKVVEGQKGFGCSNWKSGCKFVIWKNDKYLASMKKKPTKTMVKSLLKDGVAVVSGLKSKKGSTFEAKLRYEKNSDNDYFSWKMEFDNNKQAK
ncbi:type IA DNA topoisomerase [Paenalkalicoccus suaedae]|uniref:DNA topoisomerase n=1 Tax=Paenalkalicoccus suaedae TaxID=2592382 RepID=A0A859FD38_9BACI|nr:type IA DNA topoisomerase [Paenalkalicoccus suaedae]QKS71273.1 type IA DNA topoisomerase [Paenalkalicoccus suaedae]